MSIQNIKSPQKYGLTKEFFVTFWENIKYVSLNSCRTAQLKKELYTWQRQAVIKLIEMKDKDKRFIKNWQAISLLNIDYEIISIGKNGRLIVGITEITEALNKE